MNRDLLEFRITQYLDGTLPADERAELERQLADDAEARRLLAEHEALDAALAKLPAMPAVNWDRLAVHLSASVEAEEAPVRNYSIAWARPARRLAVAACVLLAAGVGWRWLSAPRDTGVTLSAVTDIKVMEAEPAAGPMVAEVSIGPSKLVELYGDPHDREDVITRTSQVVIASDSQAAQDIDRPY